MSIHRATVKHNLQSEECEKEQVAHGAHAVAVPIESGVPVDRRDGIGVSPSGARPGSQVSDFSNNRAAQ